MTEVHDEPVEPSHNYETTKPRKPLRKSEVYESVDSDAASYDSIADPHPEYTELQSEQPQQPATHEHKDSSVYLDLVYNSDSPSVPKKEVHGEPTRPSDESTKSPATSDTWTKELLFCVNT